MPTTSLKSGAEEIYRTFDEAYEINEMPSDRDRPGASVNIVDKEQLPRAREWKYTKQRDRKIIFCRECAKPRLVYAL